MNHYTPEYKDALHKVAKLYTNGVISSNTCTLAIQDISRVMNVSVEDITLDINTLWDAWDEYEVLS